MRHTLILEPNPRLTRHKFKDDTQDDFLSVCVTDNLETIQRMKRFRVKSVPPLPLLSPGKDRLNDPPLVLYYGCFTNRAGSTLLSLGTNI